MLSQLHSDSTWRKIHPLVIVCLLVVHVLIAFLFEYHPLIQTVQLGFLLIWVWKEGFLRQLLPIIRMGIWFTLIFLIANPLFASNGVLFWWKGPILPYLGRLDVTTEEIVYSSLGIMRLYSIFILSVMFQRFIDHDRFMFTFAKVAPRFVMTSVMAFRLFPYLTQEYSRIMETAYVRGIRPTGSTMREKLAHSMLLLRPLLMSALEGSWITAETMYARGFGSGPRSSYQQMVLNRSEIIGLFFIALIFLFALFGRLLAFGRFDYFPTFHWRDPVGDLYFSAGLLLVWLVPLIWLRRGGE